jgi:hypothetical protein
MIKFDTRGLELLEWMPECTVGLLAFNEEGGSFEVELEDGEWYDYDENLDQDVSLKNIQSQFKRA